MGKYLPHVKRSILRLGYIKPQYARDLASLMSELEGQHPQQIARRFRQTGNPLSREVKKSLGIRANADMTADAVAALTEKGLTSPIKGIEATLLDASFAYFRHRSLQSFIGTELDGEATFHIRRAWTDCPGCQRLHDQEILPDQLDTLPPPDCANEACALGIRPHVDYGRLALEKYRRGQEAENTKKSWLARLLGR